MYPIPSNATRIKYLESTGTQYIDTELGYFPEFEIGAVVPGAVANNTLGIDQSWKLGRHSAAEPVWRATINGISHATSVSCGTYADMSYHGTIFKCNSNTITVAANQYNYGTMVLFSTGVALPSAYPLKLYYCRLFDQNGNLVRSYVPVRVGQTGCLFDRVTGQFFYNQGTGSFVCGEDDFSVFSYAVKHLSDTGTVLASRMMGDSSGTVKAVRKYYDMPMQYTIDECNGNEPTAVNVYFPSAKYDALDYTPTWTGHRFDGWSIAPQNAPYDAEVEYLETTGSQMINTGLSFATGSFRAKAEGNIGVETNCLCGIQGDATSGTTQNKRWLVVFNGNTDNCYYDRGTTGGRVNKSGLFMDTGKVAFSIVLNSAKAIKLAAPTIAGSPIFKGKILIFQLWDSNDDLVFDGIPVRVGQVGYIYDRVSGELFGNTGTGSFLVGPDKRAVNVSPSDSVIYGSGTVYGSWQSPVTVTFDATTNGGAMPSGWTAPYYYGGQQYGTLPVPTKSGSVFVGWFNSADHHITESKLVPYGGLTLTAKYAVITYDTSFQVTTTSSYKKTGIYSATSRNSSNPTVVDWGDGTTDVVYGNISQLAHTYSSNGTFTVQVNDNISNIALSANDSTWYDTTSQNRYTVKKVLSLGSNVTSLPTYAFRYCSAMTDALIPASATTIPENCFSYCSALKSVTIPSTITSIGNNAFYNCTGASFTSVTIPASVTSIGVYAFGYCYYLKNITFESSSSTLTLGTYSFAYCFYQSAAVGTVDLSPRKITSIPNYCFYYCRYLKGITWPQGLTSIGGSAFRYCFYYSASTGTVEIPEGVTSISGTYAFGNCLYLTAVTLPSTLTSLNDYTFYYCTRLAAITSNRSTAPTVSAATFGNSATYYTGRTSYSAGTNKLYVPAGATGYTSSYWADPLCSSTKCGFTLEYAAYVPTSFPVGVKITRLSDNTVVYEGTLTNTSTCNTITGTAPVYVGPDSGYYVLGWAGVPDGVGTFGYNATTFEILEISTGGVDVSDQYKAEWVEVAA